MNNKKKYRIVNKFRFFMCMLILSSIFTLCIFTAIVNAKEVSNTSLVPIYIEKGDTLWTLSSKYCDVKTDIRDYITHVMEVNKLSSANITPGELIYFPVQ